MKHPNQTGCVFSQAVSSRGLTLMELLVSVIILAAVIVGVVMLINQALSDSKATVTGQYIKSFGTAANAYIRDNYADLTAAASDTVPALITAADLNPATGKSYLNGARATTPDGQNICVLVFEKTPGTLEGLVVTEGGTALDDLTLGQVAGTIGGAGGGAYAHDSAATIKGTMGGWSLTTASYTNITNNKGKKCDGVTAGAVQVTAGHPAMALWFQDMTSGTAAAGPSLTLYWDEPVETFAALPTCDLTTNVGHSRIVKTATVGGNEPRAYTCNGSSWIPLAVDDNGDLSVERNVTIRGSLSANGTMAATNFSFNHPDTNQGDSCTQKWLISMDAGASLLLCDGTKFKYPVSRGYTGTVSAIGMSTTDCTAGAQLAFLYEVSGTNAQCRIENQDSSSVKVRGLTATSTCRAICF